MCAGKGRGELHGDLQREGARPPRPHVQRQDRAQGSFPNHVDFFIVCSGLVAL